MEESTTARQQYARQCPRRMVWRRVSKSKPSIHMRESQSRRRSAERGSAGVKETHVKHSEKTAAGDGGVRSGSGNVSAERAGRRCQGSARWQGDRHWYGDG